MITHVASADEARGRVVIRFRTSLANRAALSAALHVARVFESTVEGIYIEPSDVKASARYAFTREISLNGKFNRNLDADHIGNDARLAAASLRSQLFKLAAAHSVPCRFQTVAGDPVSALASACQQNGPWNVVVLADSFDGASLKEVELLFSAPLSATGVIVCGPRASRVQGPIVIVAEDIDRLPGILRVAQKLQRPGADIVLLIIAPTEEQLTIAEGQMRLALGSDFSSIARAISDLTLGEPKVVTEALRRLGGSLVIRQYGGQQEGQYKGQCGEAKHGRQHGGHLTGGGANIKELLRVLRCPLLLVP